MPKQMYLLWPEVQKAIKHKTYFFTRRPLKIFVPDWLVNNSVIKFIADSYSLQFFFYI